MVLAAQGLRNLDAGTEPIDDCEIEARLRRQARKLVIAAVVSALVITVIVVMVLWEAP